MPVAGEEIGIDSHAFTRRDLPLDLKSAKLLCERHQNYETKRHMENLILLLRIQAHSSMGPQNKASTNARQSAEASGQQSLAHP